MKASSDRSYIDHIKNSPIIENRLNAPYPIPRLVSQIGSNKELKLAGFRLECDIDASRSMTEWYKEIRKTAIIRNSQMRNAAHSV